MSDPTIQAPSRPGRSKGAVRPTKHAVV